MKARLLWFVCLLTAAGLILTSAQDVKYIQLGGTLELGPDITSVTAPISGVLWKHGPNKVTEWDLGFDFPVDYYGTFRSRTRLDKVTGKLVVNNMTTEDGGEYSVEVNGRVQNRKYPVVVIKAVPTPKVSVKPLICTRDSTSCTLFCEGDVTGADPVTYRWKKDEGEWMVSAQPLNINNDEEGKKVLHFSCEIKNPVGGMQSEPIKNPFYEESSNGAIGVVVGVVVGVVLLLIMVAVGSLFGVKYIDCLNKMVPVSKRDGLPGPLKSFLFPPEATIPLNPPVTPASGDVNGVPATPGTENETTGLLDKDAPTTNNSNSAHVPTAVVTEDETTATTADDLEAGSARGKGNGGNPQASEVTTDPHGEPSAESSELAYSEIKHMGKKKKERPADPLVSTLYSEVKTGSATDDHL